MTEEKYLALRDAGIDQFSVSLDFPDERHDEFRVHPGLYRHLEDLVPRLARLGHDDIVLNSCITSENVGEINAIADKAREWGVNLCYSAYSARRTGCRDLFLNTPEQIAELNAPTGPRGGAPRPDQLDRQRAHHAGGHAALLRERRDPRLQGRPAVPGGDRRRGAAALLDAVPAVPARRAGAHGPASSPAPTSATNATCRSARYLDKSFPQLLWENVSGFLSIR